MMNRRDARGRREGRGDARAGVPKRLPEGHVSGPRALVWGPLDMRDQLHLMDRGVTDLFPRAGAAGSDAVRQLEAMHSGRGSGALCGTLRGPDPSVTSVPRLKTSFTFSLCWKWSVLPSERWLGLSSSRVERCRNMEFLPD
ncbi:hypothetical protein EYF80_041864 [Liparis tanakae]|uniref:Uncharacterized protein n=1 Tax=Liparis tanakae TaxID=230148 RepID=A0A4Z2G3M0_9TELE|nr:hypothetical protein EYF80_041864 [Liparis tanakae]